MSIAISIISSCVVFGVITFLFEVITWPHIDEKLRLKEQKLEEEASFTKTVAIDKKLIKFMYAGNVITLLMAVALCFPQVHKFLGADSDIGVLPVVIIGVIVWGVAIFDTVVIYLLSLKVYYGDDGFTVVNAFGVRKNYRRDDVVEVRGKRNKKIVLRRGSFILFNAMSGLRQFLIYLNIQSDYAR